MLSRDSGPTTTHGFLVAVELENGSKATPEVILLRLLEGLNFMEGVGDLDAEHLGVIEIVDPEIEPLATLENKES